MKQLIAILLLMSSFSCTEKPIKMKKFDFIIVEKIQLQNEDGGFDYFLKDKDTIVECGTTDFANYNEGDTLKLEKALEGFWRNKVYKSK